MGFQEEMQTLVTRLQERFSRCKFTVNSDIKGLINVSSITKDGNIQLMDFYDIIAVVDNFCMYRKFKFEKNKGSIAWWQGKETIHSSDYKIGVGFQIYIKER